MADDKRPEHFKVQDHNADLNAGIDAAIAKVNAANYSDAFRKTVLSSFAGNLRARADAIHFEVYPPAA
jgi:hypothetical protein